MKPATPLPWIVDGDEVTDGTGTVADVFGETSEDREQNAAYIAHAANMYPKLVEALQWAVERLDDNYPVAYCEERMRQARALLAECEGD